MTHPALQTVHELSPDIFREAYDWFFEDEVLRRWRDTRTSWQLHCLGGPGSGKTALSALVAEHLRTHSGLENYPIISIFITQDVPDRDTHFIEDLLDTILQQLAHDTPADDEASLAYGEYLHDRKYVYDGTRRRTRLKLLRKALYLRLQTLEHSRGFLLLDGIDRCDPTLRWILEEELSCLQKAGLSILLTSRLGIFQEDHPKGRCDHFNHGDAPDDAPVSLEDLELLELYQICECQPSGAFVLCLTCSDAGRGCLNCDSTTGLHEPYDHVNVRVAIPETAMINFIAWDLEREHGDLGLQSSARKPPLSSLGKSIRANTAKKSIQKHADDILLNSYLHIGIAKARLDLIHDMESLEELDVRREQLPVNITTMFDMGLKRIEAQPANQRDLALQTLATFSRSLDSTLVCDLLERSQEIGGVEVRSGEEILEATRGFCMTIQNDGMELALFHPNFAYYVGQRYNTAIHRASLQWTAKEARFEPQNLSAIPTEKTPQKVSRSITGLGTIRESEPQLGVVRRGTRAWH